MIHRERQHPVFSVAEVQMDVFMESDISLLYQWRPGLKILPCLTLHADKEGGSELGPYGDNEHPQHSKYSST